MLDVNFWWIVVLHILLYLSLVKLVNDKFLNYFDVLQVVFFLLGLHMQSLFLFVFLSIKDLFHQFWRQFLRCLLKLVLCKLYLSSKKMICIWIFRWNPLIYVVRNGNFRIFLPSCKNRRLEQRSKDLLFSILIYLYLDRKIFYCSTFFNISVFYSSFTVTITTEFTWKLSFY